MSPTVLKKPGIYLFRPPEPIVAHLDKELLILFSVAFPKVTGAVLYEPRAGAPNISTLLDKLFEKMSGELEIAPEKISVKVCGMSLPSPTVLRSLKRWLQAKGLRVVAVDIGKFVTRKIRLVTETGKLGVSYHDKKVKVALPFLNPATAQSRDDATHALNKTEILVLSTSPVKRALAKQAIEEISHWKASAPNDPLKLALRRNTSDFRWTLVFILDDIELSPALLSWLQAVMKRYPSTRFGWASDSVGKPTAEIPLETLPALRPENPAPFKQAIKNVAENPLVWPAAGTFAFRKPIRKRM